MIQLIAFLYPVITGILSGIVPLRNKKHHHTVCALIMIFTDLLGILAIIRAERVEILHFSEKAVLSFELDDLGRFALAAVLILFTAVCFYSFTYMEHEKRTPMFFTFFFIALGAMMAVCMSADMVTLYFAFELATLSTVPMVMHEMTKESVTAGLKYMFYSIAGALMGLLAVFYVYTCAAGTVSFRYGGFLDSAKIAGHEQLALIVILVGIIGFGTKAGMYPMHGWLPTAHPIAPAPASALLSGIITKAGVVAIIRLVYFCVGAEFLRGTWVQTVWMCLALLTILMGSTMAFGEENLKKRLAYSTVSQISYIMLSLSLLTDAGLRGGLLHVFSHACAKGCLFLVAGVFIYKLRIRRVTELMGVGRTMPLTLACFTLASISLVGIPPMGGFTSKWAIATAAMDSGAGVFAVLGPVVLLISALLTAGYLLPVMVDGYFPGMVTGYEDDEKAEPNALMLIPMFILCAGSLLVGVFGSSFMGGLVF